MRLQSRWRQSQARSGVDDLQSSQLEDEFRAALELFEDEHGEIISAYWCEQVEGAVALTAGRAPATWTRLISPAPEFHRASDWAGREEPELALSLDRCDELAIHAAEALRGVNRRIMMKLVMRSACRLMIILDTVESEESAAARERTVSTEARELARLRRDYREFVDAATKLVYVGGVALGVALLALLYTMIASTLVAEGVSEKTIIGCLLAGAIGATVSVITRISNGTLSLGFDFRFARGATLFMGAMRPWIGSVFALLMFFMVTSGFVEILQIPADGINRFYYLCVLGFAAGFSERWAQDTLTGGLAGSASTDGAAASPASQRPRSRRKMETEADRDLPDAW